MRIVQGEAACGAQVGGSTVAAAAGRRRPGLPRAAAGRPSGALLLPGRHAQGREHAGVRVAGFSGLRSCKARAVSSVQLRPRPPSWLPEPTPASRHPASAPKLTCVPQLGECRRELGLHGHLQGRGAALRATAGAPSAAPSSSGGARRAASPARGPCRGRSSLRDAFPSGAHASGVPEWLG